MRRTSCYIVDDERLARGNLKALLAAHPELELIGEAASAAEAEEGIPRLKPALLFLDIQMPGGDGFELLERLENPPRVIFITAYDRYAIRAFEVNAVDYLLKPIEPDRLAQAVARALAGAPARRQAGAPAALLPGDRVLVPAGRSGFFIQVREILMITADGNYSTLTERSGRTHTVTGTLLEWEERLPAGLFFRVGRDRILNLSRIRAIEPAGRHAVVELGDAALRIELKRAAATRLRAALGR